MCCWPVCTSFLGNISRAFGLTISARAECSTHTRKSGLRTRSLADPLDRAGSRPPRPLRPHRGARRGHAGRDLLVSQEGRARLQIRDEEQIHLLPRDPGELAPIAASLGFDSAPAFMAALGKRCARVHAIYAGLFSDRGVDAEFEAWWAFFTTERIPPTVAVRIERWFGAEPGAAEALRIFACGGRNVLVTRDLVVRFQHVAAAFDGFHSELARPLSTLARLARFAECYGTRRQFLEFCAENPRLFRVFSILCDRSGAVVELLCAHPEIIEEVLRPEILRRRRSARDLERDISGASQLDGFPDWLWLFVRAEQVRHAMGGILGDLAPAEIESAISSLADAVLHRLSLKSGVLIVALGKYGGAEIAFGSDLDLLFVARDGKEAEAARLVDSIRTALGQGGPLGPAFALDLRLRPPRPFGAARRHRSPSWTPTTARGGAQLWERQSLVRARVVAGPAALAASFRSWLDRLLYSGPAGEAEIGEILAMRARIEKEHGGEAPAWRSRPAPAA